MRNQKGFSQIIVIIAAVVVVAIGAFILGGRLQQKPSQEDTGKPQEQRQTGLFGQDHAPQEGGYGSRTPFYQQDGISLQHYWPGEANFSNEEAEILILNESGTNVQVKSFDVIYTVSGKAYPEKSGTWEKFPSFDNWDRMEYLNISPQYYKGEPLALEPGQKGKLHWHMNFGSAPLDGKQVFQVKLILLKGNETISINEELTRDSGPVFTKEDH